MEHIPAQDNSSGDIGLADICTAVEAEECEISGQLRLVERLGHRRDALLAGAWGGPPGAFELLKGQDPIYRGDVLLVRGALSTDEVAAVHGASRHPVAAKRVRHFIVPPYSARLERPLHALAPAVFQRLLALAEWADGLLWQSLPAVAYPEAEYIVYEAPPDASVGPHLDEDSAVTAVVMLSALADYEGGANAFGGGQLPRRVRMGLGDALFFRGECLEHWVEPVSTGRRVILQMELCRR